MMRQAPTNVIEACSPERLAALRAAFNDPNYTPAYCLDAGANPPAVTEAPSSFPLVGIIAIGLLIFFWSDL